jgi:hypothetical protein
VQLIGFVCPRLKMVVTQVVCDHMLFSKSPGRTLSGEETMKKRLRQTQFGANTAARSSAVHNPTNS